MKRLKGNLVAGRIEAGCDEAGRGCLAGPVVAAAVILPKNWVCKGLNDSKKLNERERDRLRPIIEREALDWAVGICDPTEIDEINILQASFKAMHRAIAQLSTCPEHLLIDGNRFTAYRQIPHTCLIKGDSRFLSIAAASVLAKTRRDELMLELHTEHPHYAWAQNKGYPTVAHRSAIALWGACSHHRQSFRLQKGDEKPTAIDIAHCTVQTTRF